MLTAFRTLAGLLWLAGWRGTEGLIEIVEEQRCHDAEFRLTCRDLDTHIAVLEAWYTAADDYRAPNGTRTREPLAERDAELDRVYTYSSPKHNGVFEPTNQSFFEAANQSRSFFEPTNQSQRFFDPANQSQGFLENITWSLEMSDWSDSEVVNASECASYTRSYASLNEGEKRREVPRNTSINLRAPVSYRCTGVNHCSFLLSQDYPPAARWPRGVVYIKYACFDDLVSIHYCNREVSLAASGADSEGYVRTPGYPHYYVGDRCRWRLRAAAEQRVRLTLLDVSLRSIGPFEEKCTDYVTVTDGSGESLLSSCDQVDLPLRVTSLTDTVDVVVEARSKGAYPKRGILMHYKSVGCVTLPAPSNGYLVYRNKHVAHYMCNVNHVYVDTRQRARVIWCYDDNKWNDTISPCVEEATAEVADNSTSDADRDKLPHNDGNMIVDIVIPSLLIAALFIGNAFIVLVIYKYRKRKPDDLEDEFNTIPLSANGVHSAGNAV